MQRSNRPGKVAFHLCTAKLRKKMKHGYIVRCFFIFFLKRMDGKVDYPTFFHYFCSQEEGKFCQTGHTFPKRIVKSR